MSPRRPSLSELPQANPGPVCRLALSGVVELANDAARRICGHDDIVGRSWLTLSPTLTPPIWRGIVEQAATHQYQEEVDDRTYVFTVVHPDGGESAYVYGTDITRLKEAERALERQAAELRELARSSRWRSRGEARARPRAASRRTPPADRITLQGRAVSAAARGAARNEPVHH